MKKFLLVAMCALSTMAVSAQRASSSSSSFFSTEKAETGVQFGIRAGVNFANMSLKDKDGGMSMSTDSRTSFHVGLAVDIPVVQSFYVQTGLYLQNKGAKYEETDEGAKGKQTYGPIYIEIPVLASYRYNFSDAAQLQVNFGPYFAYGISGKAKYEYSYSDFSEKSEYNIFGDGEDDLNAKRFDCGLQVGAGITLAKHYYIGLAYEFGLSNIADKESDYKIKNKNFMISVGYTF